MNGPLSATGSTIGVLVFWVVAVAVIGIPAYVVGERRRVESPWLAFVPLVGPYIVILRSIGRSGWLSLLMLIPLIDIVFGIWLAFTVPAAHRRETAWGIAFIIPLVDLVAFYVYAFTLEETRAAGAPPGEIGDPTALA
jgi:uncharacterized protein DUF5684